MNPVHGARNRLEGSLAEVPLAHQSTFEARFAGLPLSRLGVVTGNARLTIGRAISLPLSNLCAAWLDGDVR